MPRSRLLLLALAALGLAALPHHAAAQSSAPRANPFFDPASITGAQIDESAVRLTLVVDLTAPAASPDSPQGTHRSLAAGLAAARDAVNQGTPTKLLIRPGTYTEVVRIADWTPLGLKTLLVIEGESPGGVRWTGADELPASGWEDLGEGLFRHAWTYRLGPYSAPWGTPDLLGHRAEMLWLDGQPLRPVILERLKIHGMGDWYSPGVTYTYEGLDAPAATLQPGQFGVVEREENQPGLYLRLAPGETLTGRRIEAAVRPDLLTLGAKGNLVLRKLAFEKTANLQRDSGALGISGAVDNVLLEHVSITWASGYGGGLSGTRWTIRDCAFNYNGLSGFGSGKCDNIVFERVTTNFNGWRALFGGRNGWFVGGVKMHEATNHKVVGHRSIGNVLPSFWYDIACGRVHMEDGVFIGGTTGLFWELSQGPFFARRMVIGNVRAGRPEKRTVVTGTFQALNTGDTLLADSILWTDDTRSLAMSMWYFRDDEHARRAAPRPGTQRIEGCLLVAGPRTDNLVMEENGICGAAGSRDVPEYPLFSYRGRDNVFFHPQRKQTFMFVAAGWGRNFRDLEAWTATGRESDARWLDPLLRDPAAHDYRLAPESPLAADAARLPEVVLDRATREAMDAFYAWVGWSADEAPAKAATDFVR